MAIAHWRLDEQTDSRIEQSVLEHLNGTVSLARKFANSFCEADIAGSIAMAHDIGKYSADFQRHINGANIQVDHSTCGARDLWNICKQTPLGTIAAYCIAGHHGGLPDGGSKSQHQSETATLYYRLFDSDLPDYSSYSRDITLKCINTPKKWNPGKCPKTDNVGFSLAFFTRMLFSCLVDADWLDTETFMKNGSIVRSGFDMICGLNDKLTEYLKRFDSPQRDIDKKRTALREDCIDAANNSRGLFSLTAPTGSGKTLASLAFALNHAVENNMERIIYVVPYNTIIEQNAKVFEDIFGADNVIQHHSNIEYDDQDPRRFATENWDAPVIVTSNVQFFESLFSNRPSKCRKLHSIANSVIVFDEAQMLPLPYLIPCVAAISELVKNCNCSAVLATATQSSLNDYFAPLQVQEINSNPLQMYEDFRRTTYKVEANAISNDQLITELSKYNQVLCIVNTRKKAQQITAQISGAYHLSTTMYPTHRTVVLNEIREKLKNGEPCRVVSTSLIEAGVDVDFPVLYREKAGLDSVIQAAGRCNREGKNQAAASTVHVFTFDADTPPTTIQQNIAAFEHAKQNNMDIASLQSVECYFKQLRYIIGQQGLDTKNVVQQFNNGMSNALSFPFRTVAEQFHLIENDQRVVVIENTVSKSPCCQLRVGVRNKDLLRQIQQYSVNLFQKDFYNLQQCGQLEVLDDGIAIMNESFYDKKYGVSLQPNCGSTLIA